jgi:pimeloyl-ACP methyl ester carboxylesterase
VFAPSFKGFGDNKGMEYPYSLDDYVRELKEYFDKNQIACPHVIAHSFGARVIIKALSQSQVEIDKLVLTGAAGLKPKPTLKKRAKKIAFSLLKRVVKREKLKCFYSKDFLALDGVMKESFKKIVGEN